MNHGDKATIEFLKNDWFDDCDDEDEVLDGIEERFKYRYRRDGYEVYVLSDRTKPGDFIYGPLHFKYKPFYVGHGKFKRSRKSCWIPFERILEPKNFKEVKIKEIIDKRGSIHIDIIDYFHTKEKAIMVEKKIINTIIPKGTLSNSFLQFCKIPLKENDYKIHTSMKRIRGIK